MGTWVAVYLDTCSVGLQPASTASRQTTVSRRRAVRNGPGVRKGIPETRVDTGGAIGRRGGGNRRSTAIVSGPSSRSRRSGDLLAAREPVINEVQVWFARLFGPFEVVMRSPLPRRAFTLIELLVVIAIIAILIG